MTMPHDDGTKLTRRKVLVAGLGLAAAGSLARAADTPEPGPYGPFKMGIQSYSLRHYKLVEALEKSKELGLHYWESFSAHIPTSIDIGTLRPIQQRCKAAGVQVLGYGVVPFTTDERANREKFEFARAMGITYLSCNPTPGCFDLLDKLVEEYKIPVGIHNHGPEDKHYAKIDAISKAIKDHSPKIGCCIDTGHFLRAKEDPVRAVEVFANRIYGVHLKDVKDATKFTILGQGDLRTAELLKALAAQKYDYCLALEYEENEADPIADIRACLDAARKAAPKA
jgi:sugar phosphate isomerase/epimerase